MQERPKWQICSVGEDLVLVCFGCRSMLEEVWAAWGCVTAGDGSNQSSALSEVRFERNIAGTLFKYRTGRTWESYCASCQACENITPNSSAASR